jgi:hypothetical protein
MPVFKYRRVEDMPPPWRTPGEPGLYEAIARVWEFGQRWIRPRFPPGVYKRRSIEEMNALDEEWAAANFEAVRARQGEGDSSRDEFPR